VEIACHKLTKNPIPLESRDRHLFIMSEGIKFDKEKPDYSLIPPNALDDVVKVLTYGSKKYDRDNWKELEDSDNRYFAAAQRHLWALKKGETYDDETGIHHGAHAICCIMFLIEFNYVQNSKTNI
jgi:hypothetical protein